MGAVTVSNRHPHGVSIDGPRLKTGGIQGKGRSVTSRSDLLVDGRGNPSSTRSRCTGSGVEGVWWGTGEGVGGREGDIWECRGVGEGVEVEGGVGKGCGGGEGGVGEGGEGVGGGVDGNPTLLDLRSVPGTGWEAEGTGV